MQLLEKPKNDSFYVSSFNGCKAFAKKTNDLECIYDGPKDFQDIRSQAKIILKLLDSDIDAIAISVTDSKFLVNSALKKAQEKNIPIITFDSDLLKEHQKYRMAYIGTNNIEYGKALGQSIKKYKQTKAVREICIQSGHQTTPNLNDRITGIRLSLSNGKSTNKLDGKYGWKESSRCPLFSKGKRDVSLFQLKFILNEPQAPIFVAVAGFAQFSPNYIKEVLPYKEKIKSNEIIIVSADTEPIQMKALKKGLSSQNIGQKPYEMEERVPRFYTTF